MRRMNAAVTGRMAVDSPTGYMTVLIITVISFMFLSAFIAEGVALKISESTQVTTVSQLQLKS